MGRNEVSLGSLIKKIGQVGVMEKFNTLSLVTSSDMVCFDGDVLISYACIFL